MGWAGTDFPPDPASAPKPMAIGGNTAPFININ